MKTLHIRQVVLALALAVGSAMVSSGDTLVGFNFNGQTGPYGDGSETSVAPNAGDGSDYNSGSVTGTSLTRGSNYNNNVQAGGYFSHNGVGIQPTNNVFDSSVSQAGSDGSYLTFSLQAVTGNKLSLSSLSFGGGDQNGLTALGLSYSLNGTTFTAIGSDSGISAGSYTSGNGGYSSPYLATVDLSSIAALQHVTGPVYFELSLLGAGAYTTGDFTRNFNGTALTSDDVFVGGVSTVIPEPSTWALLIAGMSGLLLVRRAVRKSLKVS